MYEDCLRLCCVCQLLLYTSYYCTLNALLPDPLQRVKSACFPVAQSALLWPIDQGFLLQTVLPQCSCSGPRHKGAEFQEIDTYLVLENVEIRGWLKRATFQTGNVENHGILRVMHPSLP
ncbi:hypothetical protein XENTR_v10015887 [Xenopus tropicalis]|nr:hypothetical protein XENTR_v10015887 [Xenopus tropicalis]